MHTVSIPDNFARTITALYGEAGREWLARLPSLVADAAAQWSLTVFVPFEPLSYNYVAPAVRSDGTDVVLKVAFPTPDFLCTRTGRIQHIFPCTSLAQPRPWRSSLPGVAAVHLPSVNVTAPCTRIQR